MKDAPTRLGFGDALVELGQENQDIYVVECDIGKSTKTDMFCAAFPDRHINVGVAEQNAAGFAAGLATMGKIPFVSTYAVFGSMRMCEQVRTSICYPKLNVKIACSHGGLTPGSDGVTHQAIEDMGIYRSIPNMTVIMPADYQAARMLVKAAAAYRGPVYLRFTRDAVPGIYDENETFEIGKAKVLTEGSDIAIIAIGDMVCQALQAEKELKAEGISARVIDMHTLKPLDIECVQGCVRDIGRLITVEDHNVLNGLGSAVADVMAVMGQGMLRKIGLNDCFAESGEYKQLLDKYHMDSKQIILSAKDLLQSKV